MLQIVPCQCSAQFNTRVTSLGSSLAWSSPSRICARGCARSVLTRASGCQGLFAVLGDDHGDSCHVLAAHTTTPTWMQTSSGPDKLLEHPLCALWANVCMWCVHACSHTHVLAMGDLQRKTLGNTDNFEHCLLWGSKQLACVLEWKYSNCSHINPTPYPRMLSFWKLRLATEMFEQGANMIAEMKCHIHKITVCSRTAEWPGQMLMSAPLAYFHSFQWIILALHWRLASGQRVLPLVTQDKLIL